MFFLHMFSIRSLAFWFVHRVLTHTEGLESTKEVKNCSRRRYYQSTLSLSHTKFLFAFQDKDSLVAMSHCSLFIKVFLFRHFCKECDSSLYLSKRYIISKRFLLGTKKPVWWFLWWSAWWLKRSRNKTPPRKGLQGLDTGFAGLKVCRKISYLTLARVSH